MKESRKTSNKFFDRFVELAKKRHKKKFGKIISARDVKIIYEQWKQDVIKRLLDGDKVVIGKHGSLQIAGVPTLDHKPTFNRLSKGKYVSKSGWFKKAQLHWKRKYVQYSVVYENDLCKHKLYFDTNKSLAGKVFKALTETNNYYKICKK